MEHLIILTLWLLPFFVLYFAIIRQNKAEDREAQLKMDNESLRLVCQSYSQTITSLQNRVKQLEADLEAKSNQDQKIWMLNQEIAQLRDKLDKQPLKIIEGFDDDD